MYSMDVIIRPLNINELSIIVELWKEFITDPEASDGRVVLSEENIIKWVSLAQELLSKDPNSIFIAEVDGKIIGYVMFVKKVETPLKLKYDYALITDLYVKPEYRGKGIGKKLLLTVLEYLKREGVKYVEITVWANNIKAINLYKKLGFKEYSIRMIKQLSNDP